METLKESIYDHPKYYDLVFGADCAAEIKFFLGCCERYLDTAPQRMFEPACGTGRLLFALAKRGFDVSGLDLNPKAIDFCNARFERHKLKHRAFVGDMSDFVLPEKASEKRGDAEKSSGKKKTPRKRAGVKKSVCQQYDLAFNTINSFRHLSSEASAVGHFHSMANAIRTGGLYLLGVHLTPTKASPSETESWSARRGHLSINTHMWTTDRNPRKRVERFGIRFDVHCPTRSFRIEDELVLRSYTRKQMSDLIASCDAWELVATYDFGYDLDKPIKVDATTEDVVYVLRRR